MNVASLELCKELFKLSGWLDVQRFWVVGAHKEDDKTPVVENVYGLNMAYWSKQAPAYDLGFLLRKLPDQSHIYKHIQGPAGNYSAWTLGDHKAVVDTMRGETPEDAVAKLVIELIKQGILQPNEKNQDIA